jgi:hypothetical protein
VKSLITKLFRKKNLLQDIAEQRIYADDNEKEIIDLVDSLEELAIALDDVPTSEEDSTGTSNVEPADENAETTETNLDHFIVDGEELDDTLDEELMGGDAGDTSGTLTSKNEADLDFETALLEFFESSESAVIKLIEEAFQTEQEDQKLPSANEGLPDNCFSDLELTTSAASGKDVTGRTHDLEDEMPKNLFVDLKSGKRGPSEAARTNNSVASKERSDMTPDRIHWISNDQYYPVAVQAIDRKVAKFEQEIEKLIAEKEELKKKYEHVRSILYLKDEELKEAVAEIFTKYWSLKITYMDKRKRAGFGENILINYSGRDILVKIKGTYNDYPSHKFITQVWQDLHYSGLGRSAEGALIVNYDLEKNPKDRNSAYIDEDEDQLEDLIFIDTRVLHKVTTAIIDNDLAPEKAKEILFKNGRVEFYSADLAY